jgi:DEAD/DEAH box helicase domain-containing protein
MLPLHQAYEVRTAVLEYIKATFRFKDAEVGKAFYQFIENPTDGLFKGPYISLKTPFVTAQPDEVIPLDIRPPFPPHLHQVEAFRRLTTHEGHEPRPTLLTTGTGSGKTECFLYPVLDYVYQLNRHERQRGVKVIIMYPMNALASDQAKRLAEVIYGDDSPEGHPLRGKVTAGLLIGEGVDKKDYPTEMGKDHIIENRDTIVDTAPDIILTNFKMLDYALMQQRYTDLWTGNLNAERPMLRFIVLDELHTYDGAQGTDVANLLRRLKLKLNLQQGHLVPIGTSATIGNGEDSKQMLCDYATDVFGEVFTPDCIIEEHRQSPEVFFAHCEERDLPTAKQLAQLSMDKCSSPTDYLALASRVWFDEIVTDAPTIGRRLRSLLLVKKLLTITTAGILSVEDLMVALGKSDAPYQKLLRERRDLAKNALESLLALISEAKAEQGKFPFLYLQIQLWQRELSGIQRYVQSEPEFTWKDAIPKDERISLPMYFCRDCGTSGWLSVLRKTDHRFWSDATKINQAFMQEDADVRLLNTSTRLHEAVPEYKNDAAIDEDVYIHPEDLSLAAKTDPDALKLRCISRTRQGRGVARPKYDNHCPICMGDDTLAIVGGRTSTLSSVAVSQVLSSDFDVQDAHKRKMLTFSNSVQDAAHLAGFYEVRTYRFLLRQSVQQYINTVGHPMTLAELQVGFKAYWKERLSGDEYYYRFMPDDIVEKVDLSQSYRENGVFTESFKREFDLRVDWEICSEFGLTAQRGRTLEKMGASATFFSEEPLHECYRRMLAWLDENKMEYVHEDEMRFVRFINGVLHRMRLRGGIDHEFLRLYRTQELKRVLLHWPRMEKVHFLYKHFGTKRGIPHMIGYQPVNEAAGELLDVTTMRGNKRNWFAVYFERCFSPVLINPETERDFYIELLETLTAVGVLNRQETTKSHLVNYAIRPEVIQVEGRVMTIKCDACENRMYVGVSDTLTECTPCIDFKCNGEYRNREPNEDNYYKRVYNRALSPRIYAHEHTGLLERGARERLEKDFKEHPSPHSCNVLTATSTLEMGIDIGDLNVMANTGIPPQPSNFLQRVGRAGRKEGSALVLNYAKNGKHDLFYFAEPMSMMQGAVSTPGCFLEAKDILRRHFYAFCIDSWTSADRTHQLRGEVQYLGLSHEHLTQPTFLINIINQFIEEHAVELLHRFAGQYPESAQRSIGELSELVTQHKLHERVISEFEHLLSQLDHIHQEWSDLKRRLDEIPNNDVERRRDLLTQQRALKAKEKSLREENVIEFMTNVGLLPNYAFPETGVKLSATVYAHHALGDETGNTPEPLEIELQRPASQGIRELAPGNEFYTQKLRLEIKGLSLADRTDALTSMRYCSNCDALAEEGSEEYALNICPKCGSESWRANVHKYLHFTAATTSVRKDDAAMDDSKDERDVKSYHRMKHFKFRHSGPVSSYGLKSIAFGIEYCKDVLLTEVNYGSQEQLQDQTQINQSPHISTLGFITCKYCGRSTSVLSRVQDMRELHYPYCNHKDVVYPEDNEHQGSFECLYLYRSMQTEAIKMLLPVQLFDTDAATAMFKAGLELGMRYYYKSNPDHIQIDAYREWNQATGQFDNYLVIYDTIPGGTGYLSKLYNTQEFSKLIQISYEHIRDCTCRLEGKDGCYHCILSYGNQWSRSKLSRERAEQLFKSIFDETSNWEEIDGSIGNITTSGVIENSELEILFVKAMERIAREHQWKWVRKMDAINESYSYELYIREPDCDLKYVVIPQYRLGPAQGVAQMTKPDFQFIAVAAVVGGKEIDVQTLPEWSVYTDGYLYHASEQNMGFYNDLLRREAIRQSQGRARLSWTLTWEDIRCYVESDGDATDQADALYIASPNRDMLADFPNELYRMKDSMSRFVFMLQHPNLEGLRREVFYYLAACWTDENKYVSPYEEIDRVIAQNIQSSYGTVRDADLESCHFFVKSTFIPQNQMVQGVAWYPYDQEDHFADSIRYQWALTPDMTQVDKGEWADFWRRYNLLQFFRNASQEASSPTSAQLPEVNLDEILDYFPGLEEVVTALVQNHVPFNPDGGFQLTDEDGIIVAEAAIKIEGQDTVIDDFAGRDEDRAKFEAHGYRVVDVNAFNINDITSK